MRSNIHEIGLRAAVASALLVCAASLPARAVEISPYFPLPNSFDVKGSAKESMLDQQISWLKDGIAALDKAKQETQEQLQKNSSDAALQEKLKGLETQYATAVKERDILTSEEIGKEAELQRKAVVVTNINRWLNALARKATEQLKIAILKDGVERDVAERRHIQLTMQADELEKLKRDSTFEAWGR